MTILDRIGRWKLGHRFADWVEKRNVAGGIVFGLILIAGILLTFVIPGLLALLAWWVWNWKIALFVFAAVWLLQGMVTK